MIIKCEACQKRYFLEDGTLPEKGRKVRCVACGHIWMQSPVKSDVKMLSIDPLDETLGIEASKAQIRHSLGWLFFLLVLMTLVGGGYMARGTVVKLWPATSKLYIKLGIPVSHPGEGLVLENIHLVQRTENNQDMILVKGDIFNESQEARHIGDLTIVLSHSCQSKGYLETLKAKMIGLPEGQCVAAKWTHSFKETRLLPGERLSFETIPHPAIPGVTQVIIKF